MEAPEFWYPEEGGRAQRLMPLFRLASVAYDFGGRLRHWCTRARRVPAAVFCIGNLVAGGVGKTPIALALAERLQAKGRKVYLLSRGYGGGEHGPLLVDPGRHDATMVGDEALLLAARAPTVVARKRAAGALLACAAGADAIVMDDGFQNPSLKKDLSLVVVDSDTGFGNGQVIPAGPLREPVARGLKRAHGVVLMGAGPPPKALNDQAKLPIFRARLEAEHATRESLKGATVVAFAGIGRPAKFFSMLSELGCAILRAEGFPDHHPYSIAELARLKGFARASRARLVTTTKDFVRIPLPQRQGIECVPVGAVFTDEGAFDRLIEQTLRTFSHAATRTAAARARGPGALQTS
jgi:tetraacyldisaccharide 4'-kinase